MQEEDFVSKLVAFVLTVVITGNIFPDGYCQLQTDKILFAIKIVF